jgi:septal ring factor EnvC (AmiA/AmiB activator)
MGQANFSLQVRERKALQDFRTEKMEREKEKSKLEARLSELEQNKTAALAEAEAKIVMAEQKLSSSQEHLLAEQARHAAEVKRLSDELAAAVASRDEMGRRLGDIEADRRWLITQGFSFVFQKLRKSAEFLRPITAV